MIARVSVLTVLLLSPALRAQSAPPSPVRIWEESMTIPTYPVGEAEKNPLFYHGRKYQGAQGPVYPYAMLDALSTSKEDRDYQAVYLENQYVKISVLPEMGGRLFSATDKTNGYEFFYRQHVIKPALIGMAGAWLSGGIEWCIPHHHRVSTYMTVDHRLVENPDGSKTVWIGETELRHRMKWLVGLTLHPDRSYVEVTVRLFNRTPFAHSMLYFANAAVHAGPEYQMVFPPSTRFGTYHAKHEFVDWPIGRGMYHGLDRTGVDLSWWKNHHSSVSIFAWECEEDFVGGYDHDKQAGTMHVADHHAVPGKKFFTWGCGEEGQMWDKLLTDDDGPYVELMAGAYSDNQPDYSWVEPYEAKIFKEYLYPVRGLGAAKNANRDAAVNLEVAQPGRVKLAANTTSARQGVRIVLAAGGRTLFERKVSIGPDEPFSAELPLAPGVKKEQLRLALVASSGEELIHYQPERLADIPTPDPVVPPPPPQEIETVEELYRTGLRLEQFHSAAMNPYPYYEEALKRDPGHSATNVALGIRDCKRGAFEEAEKRLRTALDRVTKDYTRPKDGEAYYYLGAALRGQGRETEAEDAFHRAAWSQAWYAASHYALAECACRKHAYDQALEFVERSLSANARNPRALDLKAVVLRKLGRPERAWAALRRARALDPLDFWAGSEMLVLQASKQKAAELEPARRELEQSMRGEVQSYLEVATDYGACGFWEEASRVLARYVESAADPKHIHAMVYYYLGYYEKQKGDAAKAVEYDRLAGEMPPDYCFPFRLESIGVLRQAISDNPADARALYYLGNLLYDIQPREATVAWERSRKLDDRFATVHRNLAVAYSHVDRDYAKAAASMEKAIACDPRDPRLYVELDTLYEKAGASPEKRLALFSRNHAVVVARIDALTREIALHVAVGQYDRAISLLEKHHFRRWEGEFAAHDLYVMAHLMRGERYFRARQYESALADFDAALQYPENLEAGRPHAGPARGAHIHYGRAVAHEALGRPDEAKACLRLAEQASMRVPDQRYYRGLARQKLGDREGAAQDFAELIRYGSDLIEGRVVEGFFASFGVQATESQRMGEGSYLAGLGHLGNGNQEEAEKLFHQALQAIPDHLGAKQILASPQNED